MIAELNKDFQILLFYKYVHIDNPEVVRDHVRALCEQLELKGRLIVGTEGLNFTLEGTIENTETFIKELEKDSRFLDIHYKKSVGTGDAFPRLSVKVRSEIVTGGLGVCDVDPNKITGIHLSPETLHEWIADGKEFYIVDMRNAYEHAIGRFKDSICPPMNNFRDLQKITKGLKHLKNKTVLTVCTGGVRCEKASGYLLSQGFTDVYQLDGGIVSYMEKYPNEDFEGKLYVFDGRVAMGFYTDDPKHVVVGRCEKCDAPSENMIDCRDKGCNGQFIICEKCEQEQVAQKGITHCPNGCPENVKSPFRNMFNKIKSIFR